MNSQKVCIYGKKILLWKNDMIGKLLENGYKRQPKMSCKKVYKKKYFEKNHKKFIEIIKNKCTF